jgi:hypothetical protein
MSAMLSASTYRQFELALPTIEKHARYAFRRRGGDREEFLGEVTACAWKAWRGLIEKGRDPVTVGVTGIAAWAIRHAFNGRRIGNRTSGRGAMDIFNPKGQRLGQFQVISYDGVAATLTRSRPGAWKEWLASDGRFTPADEAAFRLDFSAWLLSLPAKSRAVAELLATGYGTGEAAQLCKLSPARVSQLRSELRHSWLAFQGEM